MQERSWKFMPATKPGGWSVGLIVLMPILFAIGTSFAGSIYRSVLAGQTILADVTARPALALTMLAGMGAGIAGCITGLVAIFKHRERAFLVYLSTVIGGLFIVYLIAELAFPH
jgi:hypothetical protein